jgi:hypothetical protein
MTLERFVIRSRLKKVFFPNPPEADKSLSRDLVSTFRSTLVCLRVETKSRLFIPLSFIGGSWVEIAGFLLNYKFLLLKRLNLNEKEGVTEKSTKEY